MVLPPFLCSSLILVSGLSSLKNLISMDWPVIHDLWNNIQSRIPSLLQFIALAKPIAWHLKRFILTTDIKQHILISSNKQMQTVRRMESTYLFVLPFQLLMDYGDVRNRRIVQVYNVSFLSAVEFPFQRLTWRSCWILLTCSNAIARNFALWRMSKGNLFYELVVFPILFKILNFLFTLNG